MPTLKTNNYDKRYYELTWTDTQEISSNSSTLDYTISAKSTTSWDEWYAERTLIVKLAGQTLISKTDRVERHNGVIQTGTITVTHSTDGTKTIEASIDAAVYGSSINVTGKGTYTLPAIPRKATITSAPNFNDTENPTITYSNLAGNAVESLQACISFTGSAADVPYRNISKTGSEYPFELTPEERQTLIDGVTSGYSRQVLFYIKTKIGGVDYYHNYPVTFSLTDYAPSVSFSYNESSSPIQSMTGGNKYILEYSDVAYTLTASGNKGATISSYEVTCGSVKKTTATGIFSDIPANTIKYKVTDSRGNVTENTATLETIPYVKLTCSQDVKISLASETEASVALKISGNCYTGSFGSTSNQFKVWIRYSTDGGSFTDWAEITDGGTLSFGNNTYEFEASISNLDYNGAYTFQSRIDDVLSSQSSSQYTVKLKPTFDYGENDFNFNVPICMNENQVLRATDARRVVLSAKGANLHLRPNGTSVDDGQVTITPSGIVTINNGAITLNNMMSYNALEMYSAPTEQYSYFFVVKQAFACGSVTLPVWTRGVFINGGSSPNDGIIMAVDTNLNFYICYRNNGSWTGRKL